MTRNTIEKIKKTEFFKKMNEIDKPLARQRKKERRLR